MAEKVQSDNISFPTPGCVLIFPILHTVNKGTSDQVRTQHIAMQNCPVPCCKSPR